MDPLAEIVNLLRPRAVGAKVIEGAGRWGVHYRNVEEAGFGLVLEGACWLMVEGREPLRLEAGDFVLLPAAPGFVFGSEPGLALTAQDAREAGAEAARLLRHGEPDGPADFRQLGGYFRFEPANLALLAPLLPDLVHIRTAELAAGRLARTVELVVEEALADRPGRDLIVERLVEVMLVEALRVEAGGAAERPGLLCGLAEPHLARALRRLHEEVARPWTVEDLAREAGLSRSVFSERFTRRVGAAPIEYLIQWRMALAKDMLLRERAPLETVAAAVGYQSASAFSTAFRRQVGQPPGQFARAAA